jgi:APA family basic amino acid/polyamine antiporter
MGFVRSIGRWAMTGLVINCIIGSGIFGVPGELNRLLGRASPVAMILAALIMACIIAPAAEVASQFSGPGGAYLYARTAFGRFIGIQVGWFSLLAIIASAAANANLFVVYSAGVFPNAGHGWSRVLLISALIGVPTAVNYFGVRNGAGLSSALVMAKLLPLSTLILLGLAHFGRQVRFVHVSEISAPGWGPWLSALLLLVFAYGGFEFAIIPGGEVKDPRRTVPFSLAAGLLVTMGVYTLLQLVTVATIGTSASSRSVAETASALIGPVGGTSVAFAVMISTAGFVSSVMLHAPRLAFSLAAQGEFPGFLARLHPRFHTPSVATVCYAALVWLLAVSGGFLWLLALTAASGMVMYISTCAALVQLRRQQPQADALRVPFGPVLSVIGITISLVLISRLQPSQALLMGVTVAIASANWCLVKRPSEAFSPVLGG